MPGADATLEAEWSFLLAACSEISREEKIDRIRLLSREPLRWNLLLDLAERHGTQPLLYQTLVGIEDADVVPPAEIFAWKQRFQLNLAAIQRNFAAFLQIF